MIFSFTNDRFLLSKCGVLGFPLTSCRVVSQRRCLPDKRHDLSRVEGPIPTLARNSVIGRTQNNEQRVKTYIRADVGISPYAILWNIKPLTFGSDFLKMRRHIFHVCHRFSTNAPAICFALFKLCLRFSHEAPSFLHSMPSNASKNASAAMSSCGCCGNVVTD